MQIDWNLLVVRLGHKKPLTEIAKETGIQVSILHRYSCGRNTTEPKFTNGLKLLDAYYDLYTDMKGVEL